MAARLWLLEGMPGVGKTTAAERLATMCDDACRPARWWPEEAKDHPATLAALRSQSAEPDFARSCLSAFRDLVQREDGVLILEGSAFQSTVRFRFANQWPPHRIGEYWAEWADVVALAQPRLLMFRVDDVPRHFDAVVAIRGPPWLEKLVAYVERTPVARDNGWRGLEGFGRFWTEYQRLCFDLVVERRCPVLELQGWPARQSFAADDALAFLSQP